MFGSDKRYLSISINETVVKVAQVKSSGSVEKIARGEAADTSSEQLTKVLKSLLNGFDKKAPVICIIPASAATVKNLDVPSSSPEEIKSIINLQVGRHTPYSREEVLMSYINLGAGASNNTNILLVIAHRNVVKERTTVLENGGLNVDKILFVPEGIARFYTKALNLKKESPALGLIDVSLNGINFLVLAKGSLAFCRPIPVGIKTIMEGADATAKLVEEFNKSVAAYANEEAVAPESYVVTTNHEAVANILPALTEQLKVQFQSKPFTNFIKASTAIKKRLEKDFGDDSFLDVIAPVTAVVKAEVNLMPEEMILKKTVERQSKEATRAGVAAVVIMLLIGGMIMSNIYFKDAFLNKKLREQYASQREEVKTLQARMAKDKIVRDYLQKRLVSLDVIHELYAVTPQQIYLNSINLEDDGSVSIDGISESMSQVFSYVKALSDSSMFTDVKTKSTATKKDAGKDVAAFQIVFKLKES